MAPRPNPRPNFGSPTRDNGLRLSPAELARLQEHAIKCTNDVRTVRQKDAGHVLLRGTESGGATPAMGHYCGFLSIAGLAPVTRHQFLSPVPNTDHGWVWGLAFVRFEVYRYATDYLHTMISLHGFYRVLQGSKEIISPLSSVLFHGRFGHLVNGAPAFMSEAGEPHPIPGFLQAGFDAALAGSFCRGCTCMTHFANIGQVDLPKMLMNRVAAHAAPVAKSVMEHA